LEKLASDKHSSLLRKSANYARKKFYNIETRMKGEKIVTNLVPYGPEKPRSGMVKIAGTNQATKLNIRGSLM
jgi:hypothetical protein